LDKSELFQRLISEDDDLRMPSESDPLPTNELNLFRRWIQEGARFDGDVATRPLAELTPVVVHPQPPEVYPAPLPLSAVTFSKNGQRVFVSGYHEVTVWAHDGVLARRIQNQAERVYSIDLHPERPWMLTAGGTPGQLGEVRIIDLNSGELIALAARASETILDAKFSPDGSRIAVAMPDGSTRIITTDSLAIERTLMGHSAQVTAVAWHPSGTRLATASRDKTAKIYDIEKGRSIATFTGHTECVNDVEFLNGELAISASGDGSLSLWSTKNGRKQRDVIPPSKTQLLSIALAGKHYTVTGAASTFRVQADANNVVQRLEDQTDWVTVSAANATNQLVATGSQRGEIVLRDGEREVARFVAKP
jgi:WD40 repeat protein